MINMILDQPAQIDPEPHQSALRGFPSTFKKHSNCAVITLCVTAAHPTMHRTDPQGGE